MLIVGGDVDAGNFDSDDDCDVDDDAACVDYHAGDGDYGRMMVAMALTLMGDDATVVSLIMSMATVLKLLSVMSRW
mgnify:CR=1 FL=1